MTEAVYSRDQVDDWQSKLEVIAQQPRTTFTKRQVVEELFDAIEQALETRSYKEVADSLEDWGLDISEGSLKQYLARLRKARKTKTASASRKRSAQTHKSVASSGQVEAEADTGHSVASSTGGASQQAAADSTGTEQQKAIAKRTAASSRKKIGKARPLRAGKAASGKLPESDFDIEKEFNL